MLGLGINLGSNKYELGLRERFEEEERRDH